MQRNDSSNTAATAKLTPVNPLNQPAFLLESETQDGFHIAHYWRIAKRYRGSILGVTFVAAVIGLLNAASATSVDQAHARLLVKFNQPNISSVQQFEPTPLHWLFFQTQADIIQSRAVAERVVRRLGLDASARSQPAGNKTPAQAKGPREQIRDWLDEAKTWLPAELKPPARPPLDDTGRHAALLNGVLGALSVEGGKESEVLIVRYVSADPEMAAKLANAFAEAYIEFGLESRVSNVQQATSWLGQRIEELRKQVADSEDALRRFQAEADLVDTQNREQIISAKLGSLTAELVKAQSRRSEAEARYAQVRRFLKEDRDFESIAQVTSSAIMLEALRARGELERRVAELSERYGPKHPKMIAANAELGDSNRRLRAEVEKAVSSARKEYELAAAQEREFMGMIAEQQSQMREVSGKAFELKQLEREVEANRQLYETFLNRFKEADVAAEYDVPSARIIDRAIAPTTPFKPNRRRMVLIAVILGLTIGVLLAFVRDHLDNTFKTKDDIEERLGLPVIGILPRIRAGRRRRSPVEREVINDPRSAFSEAVNDVRTAVLFASADAPPKVTLVTSSIPSEGKTTLASNLALAFSRRGKTLLIDADLRKGRLKQLTGHRAEVGLTDLLAGDCSDQEAIIEDPDAQGLAILMAGTLPPNPLELISSRRFIKELERFKAIYDHIVIDGTPLLPVSDSLVLARMVDSIIFVVRADSTTRDVSLEALKRMQAARLRPTGVVLQQVDMRKMRSYGSRYLESYRGYYGYYGLRAK